MSLRFRRESEEKIYLLNYYQTKGFDMVLIFISCPF